MYTRMYMHVHVRVYSFTCEALGNMHEHCLALTMDNRDKLVSIYAALFECMAALLKI